MGKKSNKGPRYEREIAKDLSLWWTYGKRDDVFWRSHGSGGRATNRRKRGKQTKNQGADICASDPIGQPLMDLVAVEIKRGYSAFTIQDLLDRPITQKNKHPIEEWVEKQEAVCLAESTYSWMIIFRRDRKEAMVVCPDYLVEALRLWRPSPMLILSTHFTIGGKRKFRKLCVLRWSDWKDYVSPQHVVELSKRV